MGKDKVIGYLVNGEVLCNYCTFYGEQYSSIKSTVTGLALSNVLPYSQTCHGCGVVLVEGVNCELFPKKD